MILQVNAYRITYFIYKQFVRCLGAAFQIKPNQISFVEKEKWKKAQNLPQHRPPSRTHETFDIVFRHPHNNRPKFYRDTWNLFVAYFVDCRLDICRQLMTHHRWTTYTKIQLKKKIKIRKTTKNRLFIHIRFIIYLLFSSSSASSHHTFHISHRTHHIIVLLCLSVF